jgi:hypothetical protein
MAASLVRKKIHLQHEQSISAADLANQRFLGKQKSERARCAIGAGKGGWAAKGIAADQGHLIIIITRSFCRG